MSRRAVAAVFLGAALLCTRPAAAQEPGACGGLAALRIPGVDLHIERAEAIAAEDAGGEAGTPGGAVPAHCRVDGVMERRTGVGGTEYAIGFALALPHEWNGRFLFQGGGGLNGSVRPPLGAQAAGEESALSRGFAVVSTDSGHEGDVFDASFYADQQAALNFLYLAVGKVTVVAQHAIEGHYGQPAEHSYFVGCSTGGREAMILAQRYPTYFDGIVAGAPAMRTGRSNIGMRWVSVALNAAAQTNEDGNPIPGTALSDDDKALVVDEFLASCDAEDGLADGMAFANPSCGFDPRTLACPAEKTDQCLTRSQIDAIETAMGGAVDEAGQPVYTGYLYDTGIAASGPDTLPGLLHGAPSPVDGPVPPTEQDVAAERLAAARDPSSLGDTDAWTNLSTFLDNDGKLLLYHGISDPWFSALDTVQYYERLEEASGGAQAVRDFARLYLVPGMGHCGGGEAALDRFDMLEAVVDWVETGTAPESVTATGDAFPGRSRPLCPYPQYAHYTGSGEPEDAASFQCRR